jgi:hypothetical protein
MFVKWYHTFSAWAFVAAVLYGIGIVTVNPYPFNVLSVMGGTVHLLYGLFTESWWKLIFVVVLFHALPFLWLPPVLTIRNFVNNLYLPITYLLFMLFSNVSIYDVYITLLNEPNITLRDFVKTHF